ncbi:MAG: hydrogenase maturation nickel metallochaperone HypA [Phycisphaerae bacterium]|nr:hydrogenase maturation nickel metallochaperone HypA [Phycisphaerae bacterium]
MHELSIAQALLDTALTTAAEHGAKRIATIRLRIGGLRQVVEESLRQAFDILSEGSIAEGSVVRIDWVPSVWRCGVCGCVVGAEDAADTCSCGSREFSFEGSDDLVLTSVDLECDDDED